MDAHEIFDEMYELFLEEIFDRNQSTYASKFYEVFGN